MKHEKKNTSKAKYYLITKQVKIAVMIVFCFVIVVLVLKEYKKYLVKQAITSIDDQNIKEAQILLRKHEFFGGPSEAEDFNDIGSIHAQY